MDSNWVLTKVNLKPYLPQLAFCIDNFASARAIHKGSFGWIRSGGQNSREMTLQNGKNESTHPFAMHSDNVLQDIEGSMRLPTSRRFG